MRLDGLWKDACIRNISTRGMLVQTTSPPERGTYVDIYSGKHVIVGRVAWSSGYRFGIQAQDQLNIDALLGQADLSGTKYEQARKANPAFDRRSTPRQAAAAISRQSERNRHFARVFEFTSITVAVASLCFLLVTTAANALSEPLQAVSLALSI
jgi:hypothetical protein